MNGWFESLVTQDAHDACVCGALFAFVHKSFRNKSFLFLVLIVLKAIAIIIPPFTIFA
jgi:hypothetical protein